MSKQSETSLGPHLPNELNLLPFCDQFPWFSQLTKMSGRTLASQTGYNVPCEGGQEFVVGQGEKSGSIWAEFVRKVCSFPAKPRALEPLKEVM